MATVDYFLKIDGIQGESPGQDAQERDPARELFLGRNQCGHLRDGRRRGRRQGADEDFHFVMSVNKASPKLMLACANGEHIKNAILTCRKAGKEQQEYLKFTFTDLLISSVSDRGHGGHADGRKSR